MRRPDDSGSGNSILADQDLLGWADWPAIRSFFLDRSYDGGDIPRKPGVLIISPDSGRWIVTLKDPTAMTQLRVTAPTWDECVMLMENLLLDPKAPWGPDEWARARAPRTRKKG